MIRLFIEPDGLITPSDRTHIATADFSLYLAPGGYDWYLAANDETVLADSEPFAHTLPGDADVELATGVLAPSTTYFLAARAVSDSGVESAMSTVRRIDVDADGLIIGDPPNVVASAQAVAAAGGYIDVTLRYNATDALAAAVKIQIARVTAGEKIADWASPLSEPAVAGSCLRSVTLGPFADGETVRLQVRAVTAAGDPGPSLALAAAVADSASPAAVDYVSAAQAGG